MYVLVYLLRSGKDGRKYLNLMLHNQTSEKKFISSEKIPEKESNFQKIA